MKHPKFQHLGDRYPRALEARYDRILVKIEELWDKPEVEDYFSDLILDKRGGRQGFPKDVMEDIVMLKGIHDSEVLRTSEDKEHSIRELKKRGVKLKKDDFLTALHNGDKELIDLFVHSNFNIHVVDDEGNTPLLIALKKGYTVIAHILLNAGVDVNAYDKMGMTPLLMACGKSTRGFKSIAEELVKRGAFINDRDKLGFTPLLLSLSGGTAEVAELLIERGADIHARARNGNTALSLARKSENAYIVELLLIKGAKE
ncbi:MAG TPA: ankyrin repeat domain-containing protein [Methylophilaceae bacterium]|jgi:tankyrase